MSRVRATTICPGCGLSQPAGEWLATRPANASAECEAVLAEVAGFEAEHYPVLGRLHQMLVDAYGAQHAGGSAKQIRIAYSLVGLHLALDRGVSGPGVRSAHSMMGKPRPDWPVFAGPTVFTDPTAFPGATVSTGGTVFTDPTPTAAFTVLDVAEAGARARSVSGHADAVLRWATSVWQAWRDHHHEVTALTTLLFSGDEAFWRMVDSYHGQGRFHAP